MKRLAIFVAAVAASGVALAHPGHGAPSGHHHAWLAELLLIGVPAAFAVGWGLRRLIRWGRRTR